MTGLRLGGVPLHPALVHFPVAAWTVALLADAGFLVAGQAVFWSVAYWALAAGALLGLLAMGAGFTDFLLLDRANPALDKVQTHMLLMGGAWSVFVLALVLRTRQAPPDMPWWLASITLLGFLLLTVGGHLGGRLVYHHGIGVQRENS